jgi:cbb3-type cytochrome oxidase maturation protein
MSVIYLLLGVSVFVALCFIAFFFWAVKNKQFDDKTTPAIRILFDDKKGT